MARAGGCSEGYYARLERGLETPSVALLRELAAVLGIHELYRSLQPIVSVEQTRPPRRSGGVHGGPARVAS